MIKVMFPRVSGEMVRLLAMMVTVRGIDHLRRRLRRRRPPPRPWKGKGGLELVVISGDQWMWVIDHILLFILKIGQIKF